MKSLQTRLRQAATNAHVSQGVVERDYAQSYVLLGIGSRLEPGRVDWTRVARILPPKCAHRQVEIAAVADVFEPALLDEVRATWKRTLGPFVEELPDVEHVLSETRARLDELLKL